MRQIATSVGNAFPKHSQKHTLWEEGLRALGFRISAFGFGLRASGFRLSPNYLLSDGFFFFGIASWGFLRNFLRTPPARETAPSPNLSRSLSAAERALFQRSCFPASMRPSCPSPCS